MSKKVTVVDYGIGNLFSVRRALEACGGDVEITSDHKKIESAERLLLPGVGAFQDGMSALQSRELLEPLKKFASSGRPFLGICLGMQLLMEVGEEFGITQGISLVPGKTVEIPGKDLEGNPIKRPHIGWSKLVSPHSKGFAGSLLEDITSTDLFYFVHSFQSKPTSKDHVLATATYGGHDITAVISKGNLTGCQFHPERSAESGLKVLRRFLV